MEEGNQKNSRYSTTEKAGYGYLIKIPIGWQINGVIWVQVVPFFIYRFKPPASRSIDEN
jgi:hypothetical protein